MKKPVSKKATEQPTLVAALLAGSKPIHVFRRSRTGALRAHLGAYSMLWANQGAEIPIVVMNYEYYADLWYEFPEPPKTSQVPIPGYGLTIGIDVALPFGSATVIAVNTEQLREMEHMLRFRDYRQFHIG